MKRRCLLVVALLACGCSSPTGPAEPKTVTLTRLRAEPFSYAYNSGLRTPARAIVHDQASWQQMWAAIHANTSAPPLPVIDFSAEMVVVAALGERSSGGFSIFVEGAAISDRRLVITVRAVSPGPRCGVTAALTQPIDLARVTRTDTPVSFVERSEVQSCP